MKIDAIYQSFILFGFLFIGAATFFYIALTGYCDESWKSFDLVISLVAEVVIIVWAVVFLNKELKKLENTETPRAVAYLCEKIMVVSFYGIGYSIIQLGFPEMKFRYALIYGANIFFVALIFFVWMLVKKNGIEKRWRI